jgi:hypothetical protein
MRRSNARGARWHGSILSFVEVIRVEQADAIRALLQKATMLTRSPFEETLYLDADTIPV